jgi:hypothetical protein
MSVLTIEILRLATGPDALVFSSDVQHLAGRAAVDQAFARLARNGKLLRVTRGVYVALVKGRFGPRHPSVEQFIRSIASRSGETVVPHPAAAANALGLSRHVPVRMVFVTSGRSRRLMFFSSAVELVHAPHWQLALGARPAGAAVRALAWLGSNAARRALVEIRRTFPPAEWRALISARAGLPPWMAKAIGEANELSRATHLRQRVRG